MRSTRYLLVAAAGAFAATACKNSTDPGPAPTSSGHPQGLIYATPLLSGQPYGVAVSKHGVVFVARVFADSISRATLPATTWDGGVPAGTQAVHVAFNPDGSRAYVVDQSGAAVTVIDVNGNAQITQIPLGHSGFNVIVSPDGQRVFASTDAGVIYVISTAINTIVDSGQIGTSANGLAFSPDGGILYATSRDAGTVTALNPATADTLATYRVGGQPQRLAVAPDGAFLYVANEDSGLSVVHLPQGTVSRVPLLAGGYGLGETPDGTQLYVTDPISGFLYIIDRATLAVRTLFVVGGAPRNVAFSPDGGTAVVTNGAGWVIFLQ